MTVSDGRGQRRRGTQRRINAGTGRIELGSDRGVDQYRGGGALNAEGSEFGDGLPPVLRPTGTARSMANSSTVSRPRRIAQSGSSD
jgi:hypothetical protein